MPIVNVLKEKPLKNAYIGEYRVPGENTIAYYPLTSETTVNDLSWNNRNLTNYNGVAFGTYAGVDCSYFAWNKMILYNSSFPARWTSSWTFSCWVYTTSNTRQAVIVLWNTAATVLFIKLYNWYIDGTSVEVSPNNWHNIVYTVWNNTLKMYIDGVEQYSSSSYTISNTASIWLGRATYQDTENLYWYLSQVIVENQVRTAEQVAWYYNQTKSQYWIS